MRMAVTQFGALLLSVFILLLGNGAMGTLLAVRANIESFEPTVIGLLMSGYFLGFIGGCFRGQWFVIRVGHIRAFCIFAVFAAASALVYPMAADPWIWGVLRVITGFSFAGLYMVIESWLNDRCDNQTRGSVFSAYRLVDLTAVTLSQLMLTLAPPESFMLFSICAILIAMGMVPVALTLSIQPAPVRQAEIAMRWLWNKSPLGVLACALFGVSNGAFWGLAPVYLQDVGRPVNDIALFMSLAIIGGAIAQWPVGRLSDVMDRRTVLTAAALAACGVSAMTAIVPAATGILLPFAVLFGVFNFPIYGLAVAHTNDYLEDGEFLKASGGLLLAYGGGAVIGPIAASQFMEALGPQGLFWFCTLVFGGIGLFALYRMTRRVALPLDEQAEYQPVVQTVPAGFELDERAEEIKETDDTIAVKPQETTR